MHNTQEQRATVSRGLSRRDFLKLSTLTMGFLAIPHPVTDILQQTLTPSQSAPYKLKLNFQWQNEFLCKTIYPMREVKLRDFLRYYQEADVWLNYKGKDLATLKKEVDAYKKDWESTAMAAYKEYTSMRDYLMKRDVRSDYYSFKPIDEAELTEINNFHVSVAQSWPNDIRNERTTVESMVQKWELHRDQILEWITARESRHKAMDPAHPKYIEEGKELLAKQTVTLPMAQQELAQLRAFLKTYDKVEKRKREWYDLSRNPDFKTPEAEFLTKFPPGQEVTLQDLAHWRMEEFTQSLADKNQFELLDLIQQRFKKEPKRYPAWLQYMVVHFSGMRYASAHGSWADPKKLLVQLHAPQIENDIKTQNDASVKILCDEKVSAYKFTGRGPKPLLVGAPEKEWREKVDLYLSSLQSNSPELRRQGLIDLLKAEDEYAIKALSTEATLSNVMKIKNSFPQWAWKEIVRFTPLRVTEVTDLDWEKLTTEEEQAHNAQTSYDLRTMMDTWENNDLTAWREEHARMHEVIVTRLVCNEAAEHCQHIRGLTPPGGLAAKPQWYLDTEGALPGAYFVRPTKAEHYVQGASILWLRFVDFSGNSPTEWQAATSLITKDGVGLLPDVRSGQWNYSEGDLITRSGNASADTQIKRGEQWLRWIHEATVAEVVETADGTRVLTFETALPEDDDATSAVGMVSMPLEWHLADGDEDAYNRSFVGYIPEGEVSVEHLKMLMDWNRIFGTNPD